MRIEVPESNAPVPACQKPVLARNLPYTTQSPGHRDYATSWATFVFRTFGAQAMRYLRSRTPKRGCMAQCVGQPRPFWRA